MIVKAWNNGSYSKTGGGYGISIYKADRAKYFNKSWESVVISIEDRSIEIKLLDTFWTTCNELRGKEIGEYLIKYGLGTWAKGKPYELELKNVSNNKFVLKVI